MRILNLMTFWTHGVNTKAFAKFLNMMGADKCTYFYSEEEDRNYNSFKNREAIYLYEDSNIILEHISLKPLGEDIINAMHPYEMRSMDIINRWRRSISNKEDYKTIKQIYYKYLEYWNEFMDERGINCFFTASIPHTHILFIIYALCKVKSIPVVITNFLPMVDSSVNYQGLYLFSEFGFKDRDFYKRYRLNNETYQNYNLIDIPLHISNQAYFTHYDREAKEVHKILVFQDNRKLIKKIEEYFTRGRIYLRNKRYKMLANKILNLINVKVKDAWLLKYIERLERDPDLSKKYISFFLHYQPEATTLPGGGIFENQLLAINILAKALPEDMVLYVKEHPAYWLFKNRYESIYETRSKNYYQQILKNKNVILIRHDYDSIELIDNSFSVATINGTVGWESLFRNKRIIMFGDWFYRGLEGVHYVNNVEECCKSIGEINIENNTNIDRKKIAIFLKSYEEISAFTLTPDLANLNNITEWELRHFNDEINGEILAEAILKYINIEYPGLIKLK